MNLAIISPNQNAYSETFIQAHRRIRANVFYYFDGLPPTQLDGFGFIGPRSNFFNRIFRYLKHFIKREVLSPSEIALAKSLRKNKIDIVFAEFGISGAAMLDVCKYLKIPLAVMFHGADASVISILEQYKVEYTRLFNEAKCVFSVSTAMHNQLISLGCPDYKLIKATYGPNDLFLNIEPKFLEQRSFVAIGRFVNKKAPYYTILAFKKVVEKYPDAKLYIAGNGELYETSQNLANYFQLKKNIVFLGIIKPDEFAELLERVCGFIQHSITAVDGDMEGTPLAVLEASAAGLPVIATRHAGIPDVIIDGETGLLVDEHDVDGMAENIITVIENPEIAIEMGKKGKENIRQNFSMEKHLSIISNALQEALKS